MTRAAAGGLGAVTLALSLAATAAAQPALEYRLVEGWAELPQGVDGWGQTIGVEISDDDRLIVFQRCFAGSCRGRDEVPAILEYDMSGRLIVSWGAGLFLWPHGFGLDAEGHVWTTDALGTEGRGHQVLKLDRTGRVLLALGTAGVAGTGPDHFDGPTDALVAPTGEIFVADGHGNSRVVKFSAAGEYLLEWGTKGTAPGQFDEPHALAFDSRGRLFVADRLNVRIQVFDQDGGYLMEHRGVMASGLHMTGDDILYVADYQLREGVVILDARDFTELGFIGGTLAEGVTVDADGNVYTAEVIPRNLKKFERVGPRPHR